MSSLAFSASPINRHEYTSANTVNTRFLSRVNKYTHTPVNAVWFVVILSISLNCIAIGSIETATAIFSITAPALDLSYIAVIFAHQFYKSEVNFVEGPFTLGRLGKPINVISIAWVLFISTILFFPPQVPVTAANMYVDPTYNTMHKQSQSDKQLGTTEYALVHSSRLLHLYGGGFLPMSKCTYSVLHRYSKRPELLISCLSIFLESIPGPGRASIPSGSQRKNQTISNKTDRTVDNKISLGSYYFRGQDKMPLTEFHG